MILLQTLIIIIIIPYDPQWGISPHGKMALFMILLQTLIIIIIIPYDPQWGIGPHGKMA